MLFFKVCFQNEVNRIRQKCLLFIYPFSHPRDPWRWRFMMRNYFCHQNPQWTSSTKKGSSDTKISVRGTVISESQIFSNTIISWLWCCCQKKATTKKTHQVHKHMHTQPGAWQPEGHILIPQLKSLSEPSSSPSLRKVWPFCFSHPPSIHPSPFLSSLVSLEGPAAFFVDILRMLFIAVQGTLWLLF